MKWKAVVEDYFTFNKPQRRSILAAVALIIACLALRFGYGYFVATETIPADTSFLNEAARLTRPDTSVREYASRYNNSYDRGNDETNYRETGRNYTPNTRQAKGELFPFDPNTLDAAGWKRLGLKDKTVATIQNYLSKGGHFRQPDDLKRIYGLHPDEAERLVPYVRIAGNSAPGREEHFTKTENTAATARPFSPKTIDINTADTTAFIMLPGIGSKLAGRIISFREKLGGFYKIDQVSETFGLPDSVFQQVKARLTISAAPEIKKLNVNMLDANGLKANPYIRWNVANAIFQYRQQHGNYTSLNDLKKIALIDEQLWLKISPYLTVE